MKPDFLIIGAMKCGTTTLFRDLSKHPSIFAPGNKEPEVFLRDVQPRDHAADYAALFAGADARQLKGEASTAYTKRPDIVDIPDRALALCGPDLKLIYLRRDPVARIASHYRHALEHGTITVPFSVALRQHPELIAYTRYDWQLELWHQAFGREAIMVLELEDYSANRQKKLAEVLHFLGLSALEMPSINPEEHANTAGEAKTIGNPLLRSVIYSNFYQNKIKTLFSDELRAKVRKAILPSPERAELDISSADRAFIKESLSSNSPVREEPAV